MSWLDPVSYQPPPSDASIERIWSSVEIRPIESIPTALSEYVAELQRVMDGTAIHARFEVEGSSEFNWFASRNRWDEISLFPQFFLHPTVQRVIPDVVGDASFSDSISVEWLSSLTLDGELARIIVAGGAYSKFEGTPREAKDFGSRVCDALFGDRFLDILVARCGECWSPWFYGSGIDYSCILIDKRLCTLSLLACTNTD